MFFPTKSQLILMDFRRTLEVLSRSRSLRCSKIFTSTSAYSERCEKWRETVKLKKHVMHFKMSMMSMTSMFCDVLWCLMMFYDVSRCLWCFMMCYYVLLCFMFFWKNNRFSMIQHMFSDIYSDFRMAGKLLKPTTFPTTCPICPAWWWKRFLFLTIFKATQLLVLKSNLATPLGEPTGELLPT